MHDDFFIHPDKPQIVFPQWQYYRQASLARAYISDIMNIGFNSEYSHDLHPDQKEIQPIIIWLG